MVSDQHFDVIFGGLKVLELHAVQAQSVVDGLSTEHIAFTRSPCQPPPGEL